MPARKQPMKARGRNAAALKTSAAPERHEDIQARIDRAVAKLDAPALDALLSELYTPTKEAAAPFAPAIELKQAHRRADDERLEGDIAVNWANSISRAKRRVVFDRKMRNGFDGLRLVSEGDSWFQYPLLLDDIIDDLSEDEDKAILSLDAAGDVVADMAATAEFVEALAECKPHAFLLSAGGNDLLGDGALEQILKPYAAGMTAADVLHRDKLNGRIDTIMTDYRSILRRVSDAVPGLPMFSHGYDYAQPRKNGKWLGTPLEAKRIPLNIGRDVIRMIVDMFNTRLAGLAQEFDSYHHVDLRHVVEDASSAWYDELHPKNAGYARAAEAFRSALSMVQRGGNEADMRVGPNNRPNARVAFCCEADRTSGMDGPLSRGLEANATKPAVDRFIPTTQKSGRNGNQIDRIVVHYTTSRSIEGTISWFKSNPNKTSSHYIVGRDGELVQMVEDGEAAHHAGPMNKRSIGIEHVAANGDAITDPQGETSSRLIAWLMEEYGVSKANVIPHRCVKDTDCCGDLFKAFGGKAGADCDTQRDALHAWMSSMGIGEGVEVAFEDDRGAGRYSRRFENIDCDCGDKGKAGRQPRHVGGHMIAADTAASRTGSSVSTLARSLMTDARRLSGNARRAPHRADVDEGREFSGIPIGRHIDLSPAGNNLKAAEAMVAWMLPGLEAETFDAAAFNAFMASLGLRYFTPVEFLFLGASNASGECAGMNELPPRSLWNNIANTARMLDEVRHRLGSPIRILSCYRNQDYNSCIDGEPQSLHMRFNAVDWRCDTGNVAEWRDVARAVRASESRYMGGIGSYAGQRFVHIDTRGSEANWQR